jgi:hypothetical protein
MYAASMATEEGQSIVIEVTWIDPDDPDPHPPERLVADRWAVVPLASPIPLTTRALVKVAKATDPRTSSFAAYGSDLGELFIWGMVDQGSRLFDFMRFDHPSARDRPGVFQASALGVGHVAIAIEYEPIAELRIDRISGRGLDPLNVGPIFDALQPGLREHLRAVTAVVPSEIYGGQGRWNDTLSSQWMVTFARLLARIRGMGHGGAVLITPDASETGLDVKYRIDYPRLRQGLCRLGVAVITKSHADDVIWKDISNDEVAIDAREHLDEAAARSEEDEAKNQVDGTLWFIACLSRVDGLVLMSPDMLVMGFGAIISVEKEPDAIFEARDEQGIQRIPFSYGEVGTRHRSMMRYCNAHPGSVGFVISQDGDVWAMTKVNDDLVVWDGVSLIRTIDRLG